MTNETKHAARIVERLNVEARRCKHGSPLRQARMAAASWCETAQAVAAQRDELVAALRKITNNLNGHDQFAANEPFPTAQRLWKKAVSEARAALAALDGAK